MRALLIPTLALAALTGCVETTDTAATTLAPTAADRATPAYQACVSAIARETGNRTADVSVFNYLFSEAGTQVEATIPGANAPWRCLAANDGTVEEVMFTGSEGSL
jgi:curli biogenesis system outer membrane secretion channel CsgG